jgi:hypothetical protein
MQTMMAANLKARPSIKFSLISISLYRFVMYLITCVPHLEIKVYTALGSYKIDYHVQNPLCNRNGCN